MGAGNSIPGEPTWDGEEADTTGWPGLESMVCDHCGRLGGRLLRCAVCRGAFFCNRECQRAAWPTHRGVCGTRSEPPAHLGSRPGSPSPSVPGSPRLPGSATGVFREGLEEFNARRFREALSKALEAADLASNEELWELKCEALRLRGQCHEQLSDIAKAKEAYAEALIEARAKLDGSVLAKAEANILLRLGAVATRSSKIGIAVQYQRKAVALLEADGGEKDTLAAAYNNLGISASKHGLLQAAQASFEKSAELRKETGNVQGLCASISNLANILRTQEKAREAAERLEEARELAEQSADLRLEQQVLINLANLYENEIGGVAQDKVVQCKASREEADEQVAKARQTLEEALLRQQEALKAEEQALADAAEEKKLPQHALRCRRRLFGLRADPALARAQLQQDLPGPKPQVRILRCGNCGCDLQGPGAAEEASSGFSIAVASETVDVASRDAANGDPAADDSIGAVALHAPSSAGAIGSASHGAAGAASNGGPSQRLLRCGRCRQTFYCSPDCQKRAWRKHSATCRAPSSNRDASALEAPSTSAEEQELRERTCAICLQGLQLLIPTESDGRVTILECSHCLHTACWGEVVENSEDGVSCPICRSSLEYTA